jgi:hypothetical protein
MSNDKDSIIPEPMNAYEQYLYGMVIRLDALCHMMSSMIEHIAEKEKIAVEENKVEESPPPSKRKSTKKG